MNRRLVLDRAEATVAAWNRGDAPGVVVYAVEDLIWRDVALPMPLHGRAAFMAVVQGYMSAFPDLRVAITSQTFAGSRLVHEWTATATHRGELMGVGPTGRATRIFGATVITFDDDAHIIEGAMYWNALALLAQLGHAPSAESAGAAT
jgi:C-1 hydroxylase